MIPSRRSTTPQRRPAPFLGASLGASLALLLAAAAPAAAQGAPAGEARVQFRFAAQGDLNALDPYTLNETFSLGILGNVMEGLTRRDGELKIVPALATRWEQLSPTHWRFHLRRGVRFHDGSPFTARDVVFSAERARAPGSQVRSRLPEDATFQAVDDHTVDVLLGRPNPTLLNEFDTWYIFSEAWARQNGAERPQPATAKDLKPFALTANGTGAFTVRSHVPGVETVLRRNEAWWDAPRHNLDEAVFRTMPSAAERKARLLDGSLDWIDPVTVQDAAEIERSAGARVLSRPELRAMMLFVDTYRPELLHADVKGRNPLADERVRRAIRLAIDLEALRRDAMDGDSQPAGTIVSPLIFPEAKRFAPARRDLERARGLLREAGFPDGFRMTMDCPADRYVNDERVCRTVARHLKDAGLEVDVDVMPKARFFEKVGPAGGYRTSFYLFGWTPPSLEVGNVLHNLAACIHQLDGATLNRRGYCSRDLTAISERLRTESDPAARDELAAKALAIVDAETGIIPLHYQQINWGVSRHVELVQRADNQLLLYEIRKNAP